MTEAKLAALADIREQVEQGTLQVRQATPEDIAALDAAVARRPVSPGS